MSMQRYPTNPIEKRKQAVRRYSRNGVVGVGIGVVGGVALWALASEVTFFFLGLIIAVVLGLYNWKKVQRIVNHKDNY